MNAIEMARTLGARGGLARRRRLSAEDRRRIASLGGHARRQFLDVAGRIIETLRYARAVDQLRDTPRVVRVRSCRGPCPGSTPNEADVPKATDHLDLVGRIMTSLAALGLEPILVGGMALVTLGSRRVTRDFDFVVARPGERLKDLVDVFYDRGLELAARVNDAGDVTPSSRKMPPPPRSAPAC